MTLIEAIKHLEETLSDKSHKWSCESCKQEHEQLLVWLRELKAYKESPKSDLISREALKKALKSNCKSELCHDYNTAWCESCCRTNDFEDLIDNAPTVIADNYSMGYQDGIRKALSEKSQGEWIVKSNGTTNYYACNKCGSAGDIQDKFCRECGAYMQKGGAK